MDRSSICTVSLGRASAGHSLPHKLDMAQKHNFLGIELFYECLVEYTTSLLGSPTRQNQLLAAASVRQLCQARNLTIICLQPFAHYEGLIDREEHAKRIDEMHFWVELAHVLGTDLILLPSSFLPAEKVSEDMELIVKDMAEIADIGAAAQPPIRYAFEALCWGTRVDTWDRSWDVITGVNRENFGICIDTFNLTGRIYADPCSVDGCLPDCEQAVLESMERLVASVPVDRIFLLQVADAELLEAPISTSHPFYNAEQPPRMSWSRNARLFYGEGSYGGYLPVSVVMETVLHRIGFQGWLSFEVFNRRQHDDAYSVPEEMARRGAESFGKMQVDFGLTQSMQQAPRPML